MNSSTIIRDQWAGRPDRQAWLVVLIAYILLYGAFLLRTDGYPYVLDNNESYSSWWHARNLYENGLSLTKGLTDEVFSTQPAASPYVHTHQGNFPRLFTFVLYAAGFRSIAAQIWVTTFTVGLAGIWLAFRFLARIGHPVFAALTCLLLMSDYLFFTQWQAGLYNIWHGVFFFSSLVCVQSLDTMERHGRWFLLAGLNFAALFYWELVFTVFVASLCGLYGLVLYWRRLRLVGLLAGAMAAGAALAAGTLLAQLTAYMGWSNVLEDVRLTLTARNALADPALLERITAFYREHHIIFWHNFTDAAPLRTQAALWDSLLEFHLKYYGPVLLGSAVMLGAGWGLGCWHWAHRGWRRLLPTFLMAALAALAWHWVGGAADPGLQEQFLLTPGGPGLLATEPVLLALVTALALTCATAGNTIVLGHATGQAAGVAPLLLCGLVAYGLTYRVFTGYIYSGYLHRFVPLPVFLTVLVLGLALHVLFQAAGHGLQFARRAPLAGQAGRARFFLRWLPAALCFVALAGFAGHWALVQSTYTRIIPADSYSFLSQLERAPFKGRSLVTNTYPAPLAARTRSWGYADTAIFSGTLRLTPRGFEVERDLKYLWFADRDTNPAYLKPDLVVFYIQTPNFPEALAHYQVMQLIPPGSPPPPVANSSLFRRARERFQPFLQHHVLADDGRRYSIAQLDWDYPPYLRPQTETIATLARQLNLRQALALSAATVTFARRWRVEIDPLETTMPPAGITLTADEQPVDLSFLSNAAQRTLLLDADQLQLRLQRSASGGRVRVTVNGAAEIFDLAALPGPEAVFSWSAARPYGHHTYIPALPAGFHLQTNLLPTDGRTVVSLQYRYAHQENVAEAASTVRLYAEDQAGRWQLADCITFLGNPGVPVRLAEFRRANPDTVAEHARIAAAGDPRTYEQWLTDYLALSAAEHRRQGVVTEALPSPLAAPAAGGETVVRRVPLPDGLTGRIQFSITPATRTKAGPEYFGLPFSLSGSRGPTITFAPLADEPPDAPLSFGRLRLRLRFPVGHWPQAEPILTTGSNEAGDVVYVIYQDSGHIRLGFDHWFKGGPVTKPIPIDYSREHELEISIGSLYPPADSLVFYGRPAAEVATLKDRVLIKLDGQTVIDNEGSCYDSNPVQVNIGGNLIRATSAGTRFGGEILSAGRSWPWIEPKARAP